MKGVRDQALGKCIEIYTQTYAYIPGNSLRPFWDGQLTPSKDKSPPNREIKRSLRITRHKARCSTNNAYLHFFSGLRSRSNTHSQFSTNLWNSTEVPNHHFSIQGVSTSHPVTVTTTSTISLAGGPVLIDLHVSLLLVMAPLDIPEYKEVSGIGKRLNISPLLGRG